MNGGESVRTENELLHSLLSGDAVLSALGRKMRLSGEEEGRQEYLRVNGSVFRQTL